MLYRLKTDVQVEHVNEIEFPAVTLCNLNSFMKNKLNNFDEQLLQLSNQLIDNVAIAENSSIENDLFLKYEQLEDQLFQKYNISKDNFSLQSWLNTKNWHLTDSDMVGCSFAGKECSAKVSFPRLPPTNLVYFVYLFKDFVPIITSAGVCYTLRGWNGTTNHTQTVPGTNGGFHVLVNVDQDNYTPFNCFGKQEYEAGLRVIVQPPSELPIPNTGSVVIPGFSAYLSLDLTKVETVNHEPWMKCQSEDLSLPAPYHVYDFRSCKEICEANTIKEKCGCPPPWYQFYYSNSSGDSCGLIKTAFCVQYSLGISN